MPRPSLLLLSAARVCGAALAQQPAVKKVPAPYTLPTDGAKVYAAYCASCHGLKGLGDGPVAASLKIPTPDLTTLTRRNQGQFPSSRVAESIKGETSTQAHGSADMPVWGPSLPKHGWPQRGRHQGPRSQPGPLHREPAGQVVLSESQDPAPGPGRGRRKHIHRSHWRSRLWGGSPAGCPAGTRGLLRQRGPWR